MDVEGTVRGETLLWRSLTVMIWWHSRFRLGLKQNHVVGCSLEPQTPCFESTGCRGVGERWGGVWECGDCRGSGPLCWTYGFLFVCLLSWTVPQALLNDQIIDIPARVHLSVAKSPQITRRRKTSPQRVGEKVRARFAKPWWIVCWIENTYSWRACQNRASWRPQFVPHHVLV